MFAGCVAHSAQLSVAGGPVLPLGSWGLLGAHSSAIVICQQQALGVTEDLGLNQMLLYWQLPSV